MAITDQFEVATPQSNASFLNKVLARVGMISPAEAAVATDSESPDPIPLRLTMKQAGYRAAGNHNGMANAMEIHLHRILSALHEQFDQSHKQQDVAKRQKQAEIDATDTDIAHQQDERKTLDKRIDDMQKQVEVWKKEIHTLHRDPESMSLPEPSKLLMRIGLGLLIGISIYLFLFYSSAGYLAFFKTASADDLGNGAVLSALFEAKAFQMAFDSGIGSFFLICALPIVFMGLGYLIHEFIAKRLFAALGIVLTISLVFDYIIGFEITKRVYEAQHMADIGEAAAPYSWSIARTDMNLWLILFAGFVVYLVWGFVFHFFMEAHQRNNKVAMAINERKEQIADATKDIQRWEDEISKLKLAVRDLTMQRHKLVAELAGVLIPAREWANYLMEFCGGWLAWMAGAEQSYNKQTHCKERLDHFVNQHLGHDTVLSYRASGLIPPVTAPPISVN
jgi:peptidoglycan hydrolase CwlO-like protein